MKTMSNEFVHSEMQPFGNVTQYYTLSRWINLFTPYFTNPIIFVLRSVILGIEIFSIHNSSELGIEGTSEKLLMCISNVHSKSC